VSNVSANVSAQSGEKPGDLANKMTKRENLKLIVTFKPGGVKGSGGHKGRGGEMMLGSFMMNQAGGRPNSFLACLLMKVFNVICYCVNL